MHLCDFKPHTQKTLQIGLSALAKLNDFRRARPAPSTDIGPIANPSINQRSAGALLRLVNRAEVARTMGLRRLMA
jgi:hypothetical protein